MPMEERNDDDVMAGMDDASGPRADIRRINIVLRPLSTMQMWPRSQTAASTNSTGR